MIAMMSFLMIDFCNLFYSNVFMIIFYEVFLILEVFFFGNCVPGSRF